jgi:DNA-binding response OmpR family regulator
VGRLLLVIDDPRLRALLAGCLRQAGEDVVVAESAAQGLALLGGEHPERVLADPRTADALALAAALPRDADGVLCYGGLEMRPAAREVLLDGKPITLTPTEYALLAVFLLQPERVLSKRQLLRGAWGHDAENQLNNVELYVGYLRRKLGRPLLHTVRGFGYRLQQSGTGETRAADPQREADAEGRALIALDDRDRATVRRHDARDDRESQAAAAGTPGA